MPNYIYRSLLSISSYKMSIVGFCLLMTGFLTLQGQTLQIIDPPTGNWTSFQAGDPYVTYSYDASIGQLKKSKIIYGNINHGGGSTHSSWGELIPYYFRIDGNSQPIVLYADSGQYTNMRTGQSISELTNVVIPDNADNLFIAAGKFTMYIDEDCAPEYSYYGGAVKFKKEKLGSVITIAEWDSACHPCAVCDESGLVHIVWEEYTLSANNLSYSSNIFYTTISDTTIGGKIFIGKGFYPEIKLGNDNKLHVLWYEADSMSQSLTYSAKHATIASSTLSSPDHLCDFSVQSGISCGHLSVERFIPPIHWSVSRNGEVQFVWQDSGKIGVGRMANGNVNIVKSPAYRDTVTYLSLPAPAFLFTPDGTIKLSWIANQQIHFASSSSNDIFASIQTRSIPIDAYDETLPVYTTFVSVLDTSNMVVSFFITQNPDYQNAIYVLRNNSANTPFVKILNGYKISPSIMIDQTDMVWCIVSGDKPSVLTFSLNDPVLLVNNAPNYQPPSTFSLSQNYPNPFNPVTKITFSLPRSAFTTLKIFDVLGHQIATLISNQLTAGSHSVNWDATNSPSGVYFCRLQSGNSAQTKKLVLVK